MVKGKMRKNDLQNTTQKTKDRGTRTSLKNSQQSQELNWRKCY